MSDLIVFQKNNLFGAKHPSGRIAITPKYKEMYPFSCGLSLVRNEKYQYAYINITEKQIVSFGTYIWCDPQFICGYARVKLMDNIHWGVIDTLGKIAIYPNLDYILPLESFKIWGNNNAVKIAGRYKGTEVAYIIDPMSRINLPIDFEFMSNFDLEEYSFPQKATSTKRNNLFTNDNSNKFSSLDSREEWEDQTLDAFEGDESNYWNIE